METNTENHNQSKLRVVELRNKTTTIQLLYLPTTDHYRRDDKDFKRKRIGKFAVRLCLLVNQKVLDP